MGSTIVGLATQMNEVKLKGEEAIKADVLLSIIAKKYKLKERLIEIMRFMLTHEKSTLANLQENLSVNRRTLQRDLKALIDLGIAQEVSTSPNDPMKYYIASCDKV